MVQVSGYLYILPDKIMPVGQFDLSLSTLNPVSVKNDTGESEFWDLEVCMGKKCDIFVNL